MASASLSDYATGRLVNCPAVGCERAFACDACLHGHLGRRHDARYVDAFGPHDAALVDFCPQHASCSPSMLGL